MRKHRGRSVSVEDAKLLLSCIGGLRALDDGRRLPTTADQEQFVAVCRGRMHPKTEYEKPTLIGVLKNQIYSVL